MKVVYPKNIKKGFFAGLTFQIGPVSLTIVQLFLLAIGAAAALAVFNSMSKSGGKVIGIMFAIIIFVIFAVVAFFKISELGLIAFIAKMVRNHFFDTTKKYQINYEKTGKADILIKEAKSKEEKQVIEQKESGFSEKKAENIKESQLI